MIVRDLPILSPLWSTGGTVPGALTKERRSSQTFPSPFRKRSHMTLSTSRLASIHSRWPLAFLWLGLQIAGRRLAAATQDSENEHAESRGGSPNTRAFPR